MNNQTPMNQASPFGAIRQVENGQEFWSARDLQAPLGYDKWERFEDAIERAMIACRNSGQQVEQHFPVAGKLQNRGNRGGTQEIRDYHLSRYACYLTAMNGDPRKSEVSAAQTYFAVKTHEAEMAEQQPLQGSVMDAIGDAQKLSQLIYHLQGVQSLLYPQATQKSNSPQFADSPKQLPAPKVDKSDPAHIESQIIKHLRKHGPLTMNTLRGSYMKSYDPILLRAQLVAMIQAGVVYTFGTSHTNAKFGLTAYMEAN